MASKDKMMEAGICLQRAKGYHRGSEIWNQRLSWCLDLSLNQNPVTKLCRLRNLMSNFRTLLHIDSRLSNPEDTDLEITLPIG